MKENIRKVVAAIVVFLLLYLILYNVLDIIEHPIMLEGTILIHNSNKCLSIFFLSASFELLILEIVSIFWYLAGRKEYKSRRKVLIKFLVITLIILVFILLFWYAFSYFSVPIIKSM